MSIEEIKPGFPDCIARRFVGNGWERVSIEFEMRASNFKKHKNDPALCDIIVRWENDWENMPPEYEIEIIELKSLIKELPNREISRPTKWEDSLEEEEKRKVFLGIANKPTKKLFKTVDKYLLNMDEKVWRNYGEKYTSYYSPQRVFTYLKIQKKGIRVLLFNNGKIMKGVKNRQPKWGVFRITENSDLSDAKNNWKYSLELIREALKNNENTGWYAKLEDELTEEEEEV